MFNTKSCSLIFSGYLLRRQIDNDQDNWLERAGIYEKKKNYVIEKWIISFTPLASCVVSVTSLAHTKNPTY